MNAMNPRPIRLLLVEDNAGDARLIREALGARLPIETQVAERLAPAIEHLAAHETDAVLLDLGLPDSQGLDTVRAIKGAAPHIPIVVLTGCDDEELGQAALREGAQDYLTKGQVAGNVLIRTIRYAIERHEHLVKSEHLNRVLRALRTVNQLITIEKDPEHLIWQVCELLVATRGYVGSWVTVAANGRPTPTVAGAGWGTEFESFASALREGRLPPCCERARVGERGLAVLRPERDCTDCPLAECGCQHVSAVAVLRHGTHAYGYLGVAMPHGFLFDEGLLIEVAGDLAFALHTITVEQERTKLLTSLAQSDRLSTMGMLAAGVAHEINNPLSYILYNLQSLTDELPKLARAMSCGHADGSAGPESEARASTRDGDPTVTAANVLEDAIDRAREALAGAQRIRDIARGLGTFSRVESGEVAPVNLHSAIEHAINIAFNEVKYRARLVKDFGRVPMVMASDGKLAQVFLNLIINAAHAIGEGQVEDNEIRIKTWADDRNVFAQVSDTGVGIPEEQRGRVFEPFFTTKAIGVGSGLGLSICRNIVTGFGGEISFESVVGKGTRFLVRLPVMPADWAPPTPAVSDDAPISSRGRGRILVVDDDAGVRRATARMLGQQHDVVVVSSAEAGKAILEQDEAFDLLLFDLMMPGPSGMELHQWLAERNPALAEGVVFITGGAFTQKAREYLASVGNLRIEKPFEPSNFRKIVAELVLASKAKTKG